MTRQTPRAAAQQAHAEGRKTRPGRHRSKDRDQPYTEQPKPVTGSRKRRVETASRQEGQDLKKHADEGPPGPRHDRTSGSTTGRRAGAAQGRNEHEDAEPTKGVEPIDQQEDHHRRRASAPPHQRNVLRFHRQGQSSSYGTSTRRTVGSPGEGTSTQRSSRAPSERGTPPGSRSTRLGDHARRPKTLRAKSTDMSGRSRDADRERLTQKPSARHRELAAETINVAQLPPRQPHLDDAIKRLKVRIDNRHRRHHTTSSGTNATKR